jgi:hypothetical protein
MLRKYRFLVEPAFGGHVLGFSVGEPATSATLRSVSQ